MGQTNSVSNSKPPYSTVSEGPRNEPYKKVNLDNLDMGPNPIRQAQFSNNTVNVSKGGKGKGGKDGKKTQRKNNVDKAKPVSKKR